MARDLHAEEVAGVPRAVELPLASRQHQALSVAHLDRDRCHEPDGMRSTDGDRERGLAIGEPSHHVEGLLPPLALDDDLHDEARRT
jgi:hypothetical protein